MMPLWLRKHCCQQLISKRKAQNAAFQLIQMTPLHNALVFARLLVSSNHRNANTTSSNEYVTPMSSYLSIALATDSTNHQLITVHKRLC
ncbi:delta12 fatty acid desaturase [Dorcoceras hygrometricum]|uniref:Delta12 fatty acid desaturase n=1 Tax=Dorcoceras hygrometricum TaxID=472368 RepID=A0A2Z7BHF5_9LAMI|nr:delta12 fatty acid desaturase [Dorcoceras hygrometricum]